MLEGVLKKQDNGRYKICGPDFEMELTCGDCIRVKIDDCWVPLRMEHDGYGYYLTGDGIAFYPKRACVRYDR